ncbi:MAG TPA: 2OG-Fe(II) oxygenase [Nodularia sp. (in: cyanobacteria)]|nr:2OG-Fe(II) oxygenase [Nodularia sp. (in: cyanobacteria)]
MYTFGQKMRNKILKKIDAIPLIRYQDDLAYQAAVKNHIVNLPILAKADLDLVEKIKSEGVVITSLAELAIPSTPDILAAAKNLIPKIPANIFEQKNVYVVHASSQQIMEYPEIFFWGLEQRLLNIVENYLGLPVAYNGVYFRRDIANQIEQGSRLWHIDREDRKILKIIIYLNDINENTGPLQYIPKDLTLEIVKDLKYKSGYIEEKTMREFVSPTNYKSCTGSFGTVIFAATGSIFHRGKLPISSDRFAIFFDYSSRRQKKRYYMANSLPSQDLFMLSQNIPEHKKQCIILNPL